MLEIAALKCFITGKYLLENREKFMELCQKVIRSFPFLFLFVLLIARRKTKIKMYFRTYAVYISIYFVNSLLMASKIEQVLSQIQLRLYCAYI